MPSDSDLVCRYNGGPNAGHTIVVDGETYKLRHMPSGILWGKECVIGAGCVVDPGVFIEELDEFERRGISTELVRLSGNAHVIMPWHLAIDQASERRLGKLQIGTTRRGIGPTYADKAYRLGIRLQDLFDPKILRQKIEVALAEKNVWLERVYGVEPIELEELAARYEGYAQRLRPYLADTSLLVDRAIRDGKRVLLEGAHGTLLDIDHGTYPFVTSSSTLAGGACTGHRDRADADRRGDRRREGVRDARRRRAVPDRDRGAGPGARPRARRRVRHGHGARAPLRLARPRRAALRGAAERDHVDRADEARRALGVRRAAGVRAVRAARRRRRPTSSPRTRATSTPPGRCTRRCEGWGEPLGGDELPAAARRYVEFVEHELDVEVSWVGTGAERERVLVR